MSENKSIKPTTFYYWLDPLRALAAILVLLVHARSVMFETYGNLEPASHNGFTMAFFSLCSLGGASVCMFYVLSGFLVGGRTIQKSMAGTISARRFFLDRLFRIGVPLTGALVLICIVNTIIGAGIEWGQLFGQYLGLQCLLTSDYGGVFWTLPYEIWFYAVILAFILICGKNKHILVGSLILMVSLWVFCNLQPQFLYILVCGIVCFLIKDYKFTASVRTFLWCVAGILFVLYFAFHLYFLMGILGLSDIAKQAQAPSQIALFTVVALLLSQYVNVPPASIPGRIINKVGNKIAVFSYSLFLTHFQVLKIWGTYYSKMSSVDLTSISCLILVCLLCIAVAYVFYYVFERNSRRIQTIAEKLIFKTKTY